MDDSVNGSVLSVNVGGPRTVLLQGKPHTTGIFKEPVDKRVRLAAHAVEGDLQADPSCHGGPLKAVYSYSAEDYEWWSERLGRPLAPATFGENLTLGGVHVNDALVGEQWSVGTSVLEVTQPREPCWKLGVRMEDAGFPRRFRAAGRAGAYLAIVQEGEVGAGDPVSVIHRPAHPVSIGLLARLNNRDRELTRMLTGLARQNLSPQEWDDILARLDLPDGSSPLGGEQG